MLRNRVARTGAAVGMTAALLVAGVAAATPASAVDEWFPTVRQGASGPDTYTVQYLLRSSRIAGGTPATVRNVPADGRYGTRTAQAVRDFQRAAGLRADGVVGEATWRRLVTVVSRGDRGDAVRAVQRQLHAVGAELGVDGVFGRGTEAALRRFQSARDLPVTGGVDDETWRALTATSRS